jgi:hypothetical protein
VTVEMEGDLDGEETRREVVRGRESFWFCSQREICLGPN